MSASNLEERRTLEDTGSRVAVVGAGAGRRMHEETIAREQEECVTEEVPGVGEWL
jgi:hypothetical protein